MHHIPALTLAVLLLASCATSPDFDTRGVDLSLQPQEVADRPLPAGTEVLWGGTIVQGSNLAEGTRLELIGYPLDDQQRPDSGRAPVGRFLVQRDGYLELADYRPGRQLTVRGELARVVEGKVGQAPYRYPVVNAERLHLWSTPRESVGPRFHFGVGVIFSN